MNPFRALSLGILSILFLLPELIYGQTVPGLLIYPNPRFSASSNTVFVDMDGIQHSFSVPPGYIEVFNDTICVSGDVNGDYYIDKINLYTRQGVLFREIILPDIPDIVERYLNFIALPKYRFALLDNINDKVYFIDFFSGELQRVVDLPNPYPGSGQNMDGVVVGNYLIISENGRNQLVKIDLSNYQASIFRDFSDWGAMGQMGPIDYYLGRYFVVFNSNKLYSFIEGQPEILIKELLPSEYHITSIVVSGAYAYLSINFAHKVVKMDLQTGSYSTFWENPTLSPFDLESVSFAWEVTNNFVDGMGSLRNAIIYANSVPGTDKIIFKITGPEPYVIKPLPELSLPPINESIIIDGYSQPGASQLKPVIEVNGSSRSGFTGFEIRGGGSTITGLIITQFTTGIYLVSNGNSIKGNLIGSDVQGIQAKGNTTGILIEGNFGGMSNTIGGSNSSDRNVISGNATGISVMNSVGNTILGNYIGTDLKGQNPKGNTRAGIELWYSSNNIIGGNNSAESKNIISSNGTGIWLYKNSNGNQIIGNYIGVDISGSKPLGNESGILSRESSNNIFGGKLPGEGNVISDNDMGIWIDGPGQFADGLPAVGNIVQGNYIGTNPGGLNLGNKSCGVLVGNGALNTQVGGYLKEEGNVIANCPKYGVFVFGEDADPGNVNKPKNTYPYGTIICSNSIYNNGRIGIDLSTNPLYDGVTLNDLGDSDDGPNYRQNFPVLESLRFSPNTVIISGSLDTKPGQTYKIQFFASKVADNTGYGEGQTYLDYIDLPVAASGTTPFTTTISDYSLTYGDVITATATDAAGNTSEFSEAIGGLQNQVQPSNPFHYSINGEDVNSIGFAVIKNTVNSAFSNWAGINTSDRTFQYDSHIGESGEDIGSNIKNASATDQVNIVSFKDDKFPFSPGVLAVCAKTLQLGANDTEAQIIDADIVFNPYYITHPTYNLGIADNPLYPGFFDIESVTTHEIGHILGLIHSGVYGASMFFQIGPGTDFRSLEQDDRSWLSYRYPDEGKVNYNNTYGSISGTIKYGYNNESVAGAIVLAIDPTTNMPVVHAYSDAQGKYTIPGLPPKDYYVFITPLDGDVYGCDMRPKNISAYIYCNTIYTDYPGEYYNSSDASEEPNGDKLLVKVTAGNDASGIDFITNKDVTPPTIVSVDPANMSVNVAVLPNITILFSEAINAVTLNNQTCYLLAEGSTQKIGGTISCIGLGGKTDKFTFMPGNPLNYMVNYSLHITAGTAETAGVEDLKGNGLVAEFISTFRTLSQDNVAPTVVSTKPENGAVNVFLNDKVIVFFSEPMIKSTVESCFTLTWTDNANITHEVVCKTPIWDEYSIVTFSPMSLLSEGTIYHLNWKGTATDLSGNKLKPGSVSFTTVPVAAPTLVYIEPGTALKTNVGVESPIVADFSEPIDPKTVTSATFKVMVGTGTTPIPGSFEFLNSDSRVVFRPSAYLGFGQSYSIVLTNEIKDVSPNKQNFAGTAVPLTFSTPSIASVSVPHISYFDAPSGKAGSKITIGGYGFDPKIANNKVFFSDVTLITNVQALITDATLTTLTVFVPTGANSGPVRVNVNGKDDDQGTLTQWTYFYVIPPTEAADVAYANTNTGAQSRDAALDFSGATAFVTNPGENTVSVVINMDTNDPDELMPRIQVGTTPMKIDINPLGTLAFVTNYNSHNVSVIDLTDGSTKYQVIKTINVGLNPFGVVTSGNYVYIANYTSGNISVIDMDPASGGFDHVVANINTGTNNRDIDVTADGGILVVTGNDGLKIIRLFKDTQGFDYAVYNSNSGSQTRDVSVTTDAGTAIVTTMDGNIFLVDISPESQTFGAAYSNNNSKTPAGDGKTSFDGTYYYVTNPSSDQVTVYKMLNADGGGGINSSTPLRKKLVEYKTVAVGRNPQGIAMDNDDDKYVTVNSGGIAQNGSITVVVNRFQYSEAILDLIQDLNSVIEDIMETKGIQRSLGEMLKVKVNDVARNIQAGKTKTAINMLKAFIDKVNELKSAGKIDADEPYNSDYLIATANYIICLLQSKDPKTCIPPDVTKSGAEDMIEILPLDLISESKLGVIYPNPFSETVTINYEIADCSGNSEKVNISIYDVSGRLVGNLVDENQHAGRYSAMWRGKYGNGNSSAPLGTYFVRFRADNKEEIRQIMLVR